ncbi:MULTISPECIES: hypothetical protein [unclassified Pseudomonas]|jgi:hypothetical protein|uniref:hypothetical protein n=1 Tax=unclassified Pseudomonas TaxID=196821 RepID=UPI001A91BFC3|nr:MULTISPECIES: hypothetical protein [unclassified Pseudomonas]MBV7510052.1 hypothetical protein [Pseudomonas sp. PDM25]
MPQAYRGRNNVNPQFSRVQDILARINAQITGVGQEVTIGIAKNDLLIECGRLWMAQLLVPGGRTYGYYASNYKDPERGCQANYLIYLNGSTILNAHVSQMP